MSGLAIACGEVPWERDLLAAADGLGLGVGRRYVDLPSLVQQAAAHDAAVLSPALRGFEERGLRALVGAGMRVVVVLDSIRPPWLLGGGFDCREVASLEWAPLLDGLSEGVEEAQSARASARAGTVTAFVGVSGGVGVTTLATAHAMRSEGALLVDANLAAPALGFLFGLPAAASGVADLARAMPRDLPAGPLTLSQGDAQSLDAGDVAAVVRELALEQREVVVDVGIAHPAAATELLEVADRVAVVGAATPLGVVRLCSMLPSLGIDALPVAVIVNRVRASAVGSRDARSVVAAVVERETGLRPHLLEDAPQLCDEAWLRADVRALAKLVPQFTFNSLR